MLPPHVIRRLHQPGRCRYRVVPVAQNKPVLQNAANLHIRQRKHHLVFLEVLHPQRHQVRRLHLQRHNRPVRMDCPGLDVRHFIKILRIGNADRRQLLPLLSQHLDTLINRLGVQLVVPNFFPVQIHRRRSRRLQLRGHRQLFLCRRLKLRIQPCGRYNCH